MKKIMIGIAMVGVLLVSLASAGLVGFLSNTITGTIEVEGPVFYLDKLDIMGDGSYSLKMNDDSGLIGSYLRLKDGNILSREFFSESLGVDGFYPAKFEVSLDSEMVTNVEDACDMLCEYDEIPEAENMSNGECISFCEEVDLDDLIDDYYLSGTIHATLNLVNERGGSKGNICGTIFIGINERDDYRFDCEDEGNVMSSIDSGDRLRLLLVDGSDVGIGTKTHIGDSKFQVVAQ